MHTPREPILVPFNVLVVSAWVVRQIDLVQYSVDETQCYEVRVDCLML